MTNDAGRPRASAAVIGVNGQDGSFVAERLLARGYRVIGLGRQEGAVHTAPHPDFLYARVDARDPAALTRVLADTRPDAVFHLAATHGSNNPSYETIWQDMLAVNVGSVHSVLEYLRTVHPEGRLVYAGSAKVFATPLPSEVTEASPIAPSCLYGITKNSARELIDFYRRRHNIRASILHLFNHDSERRPAEFFLPRVLATLTRALRDPAWQETVATLDFWCDWGCAEEYMDIAIDVAERAPGQDFVLASGRTWHGREAVDALFRRHGLDYRRHVAERLAPASPGALFQVSTARLRAAIGRAPERGVFDIADRILSRIHGA